MADQSGLTIGELADAADVGRETVRFYERRGLLPQPPRTDSGYRNYPPESVERLRFIRRAQGLGFTLEEIAELLALRVDEVAACGTVEARARAKLTKVAQKLTDLRRMKKAQLLGMKLSDVRETLEIAAGGTRPCEHGARGSAHRVQLRANR